MTTVEQGPARPPSLPIHVQIEEAIERRIASGELAAGSRVPAERELAAQLGVSRMTVRQGLASLVRRGLLIRSVGRGTFVAEPKLFQDLTAMLGFSDQMQRQGVVAGARVLQARECAAHPPMAEQMGLPAGARVFEVVRLRLGRGEPLALETSYFPASVFPGLLAHDLTGSTYQLLRDRYARGPSRATVRLEPVPASRFEATQLQVRRGAPLMLVERVAQAQDGTVVEYARDLHRGDRSRFLVVVADLAAGTRPGGFSTLERVLHV